MASGARKWLVGCGIGCGFMILAAGGVGTCGYLGVRTVKERAERLDEGFQALEAEYGRPGDYVPPADGVVPAARVETFLAVRAALAPSRDGLAAVLTELDGRTDGVGGVLRKIGAGVSIVPRMFDFIDERNTALAGEGMGVGEYLYIYSLAYYAWLGKDPADGPSFAVSDHEHERAEDTEGVRFRWGGEHRGRSDDPEEVRRRRARDVGRYLNGIQAHMLANQLEAARAQGLGEDWLARLDAEYEAVETDDGRLMWADGLPGAVAAALEPYRARLEESWSPVMNAIEVGLVEND